MRELKATHDNHMAAWIGWRHVALTAIVGLAAVAQASWAGGQVDEARSTITVAKPDSGSPPRPAAVAKNSPTNGGPANDRKTDADPHANADAIANADVNADSDATSAEPSTSEVSSNDELQLLESVPASVGSTSPEDASDSVRELSVEPGTLPLLPADRPAWIGAPADFSQSVHRLYVGSQVTDSRQDIDLMLDVPLVAAVGDYIDRQVLGIDGAALDLQQHVDADYIRKNLIDDPQGFVAKLNTSGDPMYQKWVTVSITPAQRTQIEQWYREAVQRKRLAPVGLGLLGVISFVGISHLALRRRHGLPKSSPVAHNFVSDGSADNPTMPRAQRRRSRLPVLMVLGCVLVFPMLIAFSLLFLGLTRHSVKRTQPQKYSVHVGPRPPAIPDVPMAPAMPAMPEMPRMVTHPEFPDGAQLLHQSDTQVIYRSGGQQIIIRKSPK